MKKIITLLFVILFSSTITFANHAAPESDTLDAAPSAQQTTDCEYSLSPTSALFGFNGGSGSFMVTTAPGCLVTATSGDGFIIVSTTSGIGSIRIFYDVFSSTTERTGTIIVNDQIFTVVQSAGCNPALTYNQPNFPAAGGTGQLAVDIGPGCHYAARTNDSFITFTNGTINGTGSGVITFSLAPNTAFAREGYIAVNGSVISFTQAGECAAVSLAPVNLSFTREGGSGSFAVTAEGNCAYAAASSASFVTVDNTAGAGNRVINLTVAPNTGLGRTATLNVVGGLSLVVTQFAGTASARPAFDFDNDYRSDVSLFRPASGFWYIVPSQTGNFYGFSFGQTGDQIAPADYDGDGKTDIAVWRGNVPGAGGESYFYVLNSSDNSFRAASFAAAGDVPVPGDYDGDGKGDYAVYRGAAAAGGQSYFYYQPSSQPTVAFVTIALGTFGDQPVRINYDGDGKLDAAVWQPSTGCWTILRSSTNQAIITNFGLPTDIPVPGDYDGDGRGNVAVFRPSTGTWYITERSFASFRAVQFGRTDDVPVPADYDGDGRVDVAVYRAGVWYLNGSQSGFRGFAFGAPNDKPAPNAFVR